MGLGKIVLMFISLLQSSFAGSIGFWCLGFHICVLTAPLASEPAGGTLHSSTLFMARLLTFSNAFMPSLVPSSAEASTTFLTEYVALGLA